VSRAHCDSLDGPVVLTAQTALRQGDITPVLKWVKDEAEPEIRAAFDRTLEVRKLSSAAAALADRYFFETLVRVHRAGEGAPYTGLQPAGSAEPALTAADRALETGDVSGLVEGLRQAVTIGLTDRFEKVRASKAHAGHNVTAGRAYVEAYVDFIHYYENLHTVAARSPAHAAEHQH
jgi:hypothetical protein